MSADHSERRVACVARKQAALLRSDGDKAAASVEGGGDDCLLLAFPALGPRLWSREALLLLLLMLSGPIALAAAASRTPLLAPLLGIDDGDCGDAAGESHSNPRDLARL